MQGPGVKPTGLARCAMGVLVLFPFGAGGLAGCKTQACEPPPSLCREFVRIDFDETLPFEHYSFELTLDGEEHVFEATLLASGDVEFSGSPPARLELDPTAMTVNGTPQEVELRISLSDQEVVSAQIEPNYIPGEDCATERCRTAVEDVDVNVGAQASGGAPP